MAEKGLTGKHDPGTWTRRPSERTLRPSAGGRQSGYRPHPGRARRGSGGTPPSQALTRRREGTTGLWSHRRRRPRLRRA